MLVLLRCLWWRRGRRGLLNGLLDPGGEAGVARLPLQEPGREIGTGLGEVAPVVEPAQFLQAVVAGLARQVVEGVAEEVNVAALVGGLGQDLADRGAKAGVVVGDDELDAREAAGDQAAEKVAPRGAALAAESSTARICRRPSQSMPMAMCTAWLRTTPPSRTRS